VTIKRLAGWELILNYWRKLRTWNEKQNIAPGKTGARKNRPAMSLPQLFWRPPAASACCVAATAGSAFAGTDKIGRDLIGLAAQPLPIRTRFEVKASSSADGKGQLDMQTHLHVQRPTDARPCVSNARSGWGYWGSLLLSDIAESPRTGCERRRRPCSALIRPMSCYSNGHGLGTTRGPADRMRKHDTLPGAPPRIRR